MRFAELFSLFTRVPNTSSRLGSGGSLVGKWRENGSSPGHTPSHQRKQCWLIGGSVRTRVSHLDQYHPRSFVQACRSVWVGPAVSVRSVPAGTGRIGDTQLTTCSRPPRYKTEIYFPPGVIGYHGKDWRTMTSPESPHSSHKCRAKMAYRSLWPRGVTIWGAAWRSRDAGEKSHLVHMC